MDTHNHEQGAAGDEPQTQIKGFKLEPIKQTKITTATVNGKKFNPEKIDKKIEERCEQKRLALQEIEKELKQNVNRFKLIEAYEDCANVIINSKSDKNNEIPQ